MDSTWINAPAKINIGLDVIRRREDGYHEVKMIMQSIRLFDRLTLTKSKIPGVHLKTNLRFLPVDENNLVHRSAKLLMEEFKIEGGVDIQLDKRIPVAAGMAGGSTDAASCMLAMNQLYDLGLGKRQLMKRGLRLGADIPYCILKGTALAEGIGEKLSTIPQTPDCYILIAKPGIHVSTKFVYTNLVLDENTPHPDIDSMIAAMKKRDLKELCDNMGNVLETVTIPAHPEIAEIKKCMLENGAMGSLMSGSGPSVFGVFDDLDKAKAAKAKCMKLPFRCFAFVTDLYR
ncbi:MAG: 4-(cytidine 5'-diphospho)-2-C-methyl-D-erythritol kinase [Lachnospiraceae bacterium]|nr:4-(cytidine 5'-diphospho)-2-C-methyl-D-erythritol kinase [Lachnospiraceae bacterium]